MTERDILERLRSRYDHIYVLTNSFIFGWESDYFGITKGTGYAYEIEVKISKSDFRADFKNKTEKHRCLSMADREIITIPKQEATKWGPTGEKAESIDRLGNKRYQDTFDNIPQGYCQLTIKKNFIPNRFYYAVPAELVDGIRDILPKYAGLISIDGYNIKEVKQAPLLHKRMLLPELAPILLDKFYYGYINKRNECAQLKRDIELEKFYYEPETFQEKVTTMQLTIFD